MCFVQFFNCLKKDVSVPSWLEVVFASLISGGYLLLPSFPAYAQHTYILLTLSVTKMSWELLAFLVDVHTHITEKNTFLMVSLLHKYYIFILKKVENKISKKKKAKITIKSSVLS